MSLLRGWDFKMNHRDYKWIIIWSDTFKEYYLTHFCITRNGNYIQDGARLTFIDLEKLLNHIKENRNT